MSIETKVPGIKARHMIVTPNCQTRGGDEIRDVLDQTSDELTALKKAWEGRRANFHVTITVENLER